jgi:hypothetical protein
MTKAIEPYNANPDLAKMREDISKRNQALLVKTLLIVGIGLLLGGALGAALTPIVPFLGGFGSFGMILGTMAGGIVGGGLGGMISQTMTVKERKQLQIDEEMLNSYMQGKNFWGSGYRQEVAEQGYGGAQVPYTPPSRQGPVGRSGGRY